MREVYLNRRATVRYCTGPGCPAAILRFAMRRTGPARRCSPRRLLLAGRMRAGPRRRARRSLVPMRRRRAGRRVTRRRAQRARPATCADRASCGCARSSLPDGEAVTVGALVERRTRRADRRHRRDALRARPAHRASRVHSRASGGARATTPDAAAVADAAERALGAPRPRIARPALAGAFPGAVRRAVEHRLHRGEVRTAVRAAARVPARALRARRRADDGGRRCVTRRDVADAARDRCTSSSPACSSMRVYLGGVFVSIKAGMSAGTSAMIVGLQPLLTVLLARAWLGERVLPRQWAGLAAGTRRRLAGRPPQGRASAATRRASSPSRSRSSGISVGTLYQKRYCAQRRPAQPAPSSSSPPARCCSRRSSLLLEPEPIRLDACRSCSRSAGRCSCCRSARSACCTGCCATAPPPGRAPVLPRPAGHRADGVRRCSARRLDALAIAGMVLIAIGVALARPRA